MRIIGIDPGTYRTGFGVLDENKGNLRVVACGCLESTADRISERYFSIYEQLSKVVFEYKPDCCAIEGAFFSRNPKVITRLGEIRGVIILSAAQMGIEIVEYSPLEVKQSVVGYGRADKSQVHKMVKRILRVDTIPKINDVSDALALALCHVHNKNSIKRRLLKTL